MIANSIVLAGGKGLRLGRDKALIELDGENLLQRVISRLGFLSSEIILVVAGGEQSFNIANHPKLKIVTDIYPGKIIAHPLLLPLAGSDCHVIGALLDYK